MGGVNCILWERDSCYTGVLREIGWRKKNARRLAGRVYVMAI